MKSILGFIVGAIWLVFAFRAFGFSSAGGAGGHDDLQLWWAVVGVLLTIAALGAMVGGFIHSRAQRG